MADVWGGIVWHVLGIGEAAAQAAAIDHVGAELGALPEIGSAGRSCPCLGVVGVDVIVGDVGKFVVAEKVLVRNDVRCALTRPGDIAVGIEVAIFVPPFIVEAAENESLPELTVVEKVAGNLVVGIQTDFEFRRYFLRYSDVEIMRAFG